MNKKQFTFIIAVTDEPYYEECVYYIQRLKIPHGYSIDILAIHNAESMCSAYNQAMRSCNSKYKIYLHQDVFIRNEDFLSDILKIFQSDISIGMIGMLGGNQMPKTGMTFCAWNEGVVHAVNPDMAYLMYGSDQTKENVQVEAADGLLLATQYDITWREDLFHDFDFYDVSQAFEMRRSGYKVVVPYQQTPWTIHDSSLVKLKKYDKSRQICLKEYPEFFKADNGIQYSFNEEWNELCTALGEQLIHLIDVGEWQQVKEIIDIYRNYESKDTLLEICGIISDLYWIEKQYNSKNTIFSSNLSYQEIYKRYTEWRFLIRRMEMGLPQSEYMELLDDLKRKSVSSRAIIILVIHSVLYKKEVLIKLEDFYKKIGFFNDSVYIKKICTLVKDNSIPVAYTYNKL